MHIQTINSTTIVLTADTHGRHRELTVPDCDIFIHLGDACTDGDDAELNDFFHWMATLPAPHKLFVPGNHDWPFEFDPDSAMRKVPPSIIVLENRGIVINGIVIFAVVARPWLHTPPEIPANTDVLLSHGPAHGILDQQTGCPLLRRCLDHIPYFFFGHIHETWGMEEMVGGSVCRNVAEASRFVAPSKYICRINNKNTHHDIS
ncbi:MAG: metallophosphoesterase [Cryomorphaceae bacterium]|nr:metallophosphoesterase [Cryomorphaceae bacterium]